MLLAFHSQAAFIRLSRPLFARPLQARGLASSASFESDRKCRSSNEYAETGKDFLIHDQGGNYLIIEEDKVRLGTKAEAQANPIVVSYDNEKDRYSFKAKNSDQALNNYGNNGFGRWLYGASNNDFWMQLRSPDTVGKPGAISTADTRAEGITRSHTCPCWHRMGEWLSTTCRKPAFPVTCRA